MRRYISVVLYLIIFALFAATIYDVWPPAGYATMACACVMAVVLYFVTPDGPSKDDRRRR